MVSFYFSWISYIVLGLEYLLFSALFGLKNHRKEHFYLRFFLSCAGLSVLIFLTEFIFYLTLHDPLGYYLPDWQGPLLRGCVGAGIFLCCIPVMKLLYKENFPTCFITLVGGYCAQHFRSNISWIINSLPQNMEDVPHFFYILIITLFLIVLSAAGLYFIARKMSYINKGKHPVLFVSVLLLVVVTTMTLTVVDLSIGRSTDIQNIIMKVIYRLMPMILIVFIIGYNMRVAHMEEKMKSMEGMLNEEITQNRSKKDSQELLNIQLHDLKHMLSDEEEMEVMKKNIASVESKIDTGNAYVDIIISKYYSICRDKNISFSCIVNGKAFDFMEKTEIYAFFGNILSNAVEATDHQEVDTSKSITLTTRTVGDYVFVHAENSFAVVPLYDKGQLVTSKEDKEHHGLGTKSLQLIAEKYGGEMKASSSDHIFYLDIILEENQK